MAATIPTTVHRAIASGGRERVSSTTQMRRRFWFIRLVATAPLRHCWPPRRSSPTSSSSWAKGTAGVAHLCRWMGCAGIEGLLCPDAQPGGTRSGRNAVRKSLRAITAQHAIAGTGLNWRRSPDTDGDGVQVLARRFTRRSSCGLPLCGRPRCRLATQRSQGRRSGRLSARPRSARATLFASTTTCAVCEEEQYSGGLRVCAW